MTYLVLARKWRPRSFQTLVGQEHVVRALTHALKTGRLHHAWLFTGTRGVGKTTLSRILAKSLNCETGIGPEPCGVCRACTEIDAGRHIDYIELDAASNRGVDEMTQLLEQAVYAPGAGRFKIYMIDEVHMLSGHAFNAMLKTLEEPPPHVKFILATTDPQKIPVTILSRCLQFGLKQMAPDQIVGHLAHVLGEESIPFELPALGLLARAARGSMRDALSLTDQAIAHGAGSVTAASVSSMLGAIDPGLLVTLLEALVEGRIADALALADELSARGLSMSSVLADLAGLVADVARLQQVPGSAAADWPDLARLQAMAASADADTLQWFYTVALRSRAELPLAPDESAGFAMALMRMHLIASSSSAAAGSAAAPRPEPAPAKESVAAAASAPVSLSPAEWPSLMAGLGAQGLLGELARQSECEAIEGERVRLKVPAIHLARPELADKLAALLLDRHGLRVKISTSLGPVSATAHQADRQERQARHAQARADFENDPFVRQAVAELGATVLPDTIRPV